MRGVHAQRRTMQHLFHFRFFQPARAHGNAGACTLLPAAILRGYTHSDLCTQRHQRAGKHPSFCGAAEQNDLHSFSFLS